MKIFNYLCALWVGFSIAFIIFIGIRNYEKNYVYQISSDQILWGISSCYNNGGTEKITFSNGNFEFKCLNGSTANLKNYNELKVKEGISTKI
jgi:hypothetical protein